jgi:hypothetical protein
MTYATMIGMAFGVLLWIQANFVDASDFKESQYQQVKEDVDYLRDKELRLEEQAQELKFEDQRKLERDERKLKKLGRELGK